jgi:hypothetical protein
MTTINELLADALIDLGRLSPSETIDPADQVHALRVANRLFGRWATQNLLIPYTTSESFSTDGSSSYTMGTAGTASSTRALRLLDNCYVNDGSQDFPLKLINQGQYNAISDKDLGGRPTLIYYDPLYASGYIYLWRLPGTGFTVYIESIKNLHASLSLDDTVSLSKEYEDFVVLGLRNRLAGSFGVPVTPIMLKEFIDAERDIKNLNLANRDVTMNMPAGFGGEKYPYSIEEG